MDLSNLPTKKEHKLSWAKTVCHEESVGQVLDKLDKEGKNISEMIRIAVKEYLEKHGLL